ncbi:CASP-like protein 4D1 [Euphorbia peplus]|nr:CASP-like protein 4D1 [Euphorbia peplus]
MGEMKSMESPKVALILRIVTLLLLLASLVVLATASAKVPPLKSTKTTTTYNDLYSYRHLLYAAAIGLIFTIVELLFSVYHVITGKRLVQSVGFLFSDLLLHQAILAIVASGIGAGIGATYDIKTNLDDLDDINKALGSDSFSEIRSKLDTFFNMGYVSASLLLLAFLALAASSVLSALALYKRAKT